MTWKHRLRTIVVCLGLEFATLAGVPMRPDEIRQLLQQMNQPTLAHVLKEEKGDDDPLEPAGDIADPAPGGR